MINSFFPFLMINELEANTSSDWSAPKSAHWPSEQQQSVSLSKPLEGSWPPARHCWTPTKLPQTATQHRLHRFYTVHFPQSAGVKESEALSAITIPSLTICFLCSSERAEHDWYHVIIAVWNTSDAAAVEVVVMLWCSYYRKKSWAELIGISICLGRIISGVVSQN